MIEMGVGNYAVLNCYPNGNGHFWKCVLSVRISGASGRPFKLIQLIVRLTVSSWVITLMGFQKKLLTISRANGTAFKLIQLIVRCWVITLMGFQKKLLTRGMTFCFLQDTHIFAHLICTLKSDFKGATQIFFWAGIQFFFLIYLMKPSFFSGYHPEKSQVKFYPIFFRVAKTPIFSKLKVGWRLKGRLYQQLK